MQIHEDFARRSKNNSKDFLIKIDGDGQFSNSDIEKIIDLYINYDYEFINQIAFGVVE